MVRLPKSRNRGLSSDKPVFPIAVSMQSDVPSIVKVVIGKEVFSTAEVEELEPVSHSWLTKFLGLVENRARPISNLLPDGERMGAISKEESSSEQTVDRDRHGWTVIFHGNGKTGAVKAGKLVNFCSFEFRDFGTLVNGGIMGCQEKGKERVGQQSKRKPRLAMLTNGPRAMVDSSSLSTSESDEGKRQMSNHFTIGECSKFFSSGGQVDQVGCIDGYSNGLVSPNTIPIF
ncbi:hypothetical protein Q3G72_032298 [Acer saccharum]|nr:hypothetical protein Q3G72_032298 [Acer saccharum]